jgi:hypothetical protein
MFPAHGGTLGLVVEIAPLVLLVIGGVVVWHRSRGADPDAPGPGDEAAVEEERRDAE